MVVERGAERHDGIKTVLEAEIDQIEQGLLFGFAHLMGPGDRHQVVDQDPHRVGPPVQGEVSDIGLSIVGPAQVGPA